MAGPADAGRPRVVVRGRRPCRVYVQDHGTRVVVLRKAAPLAMPRGGAPQGVRVLQAPQDATRSARGSFEAHGWGCSYQRGPTGIPHVVIDVPNLVTPFTMLVDDWSDALRKAADAVLKLQAGGVPDEGMFQAAGLEEAWKAPPR